MDDPLTMRNAGPKEMREQAELAQVWAALAVAISVVVLLSNLGAEPEALTAARASAESHRESVAVHEQLLRDTEFALRQTEHELARIRVGRPTTP